MLCTENSWLVNWSFDYGWIGWMFVVMYPDVMTGWRWNRASYRKKTSNKYMKWTSAWNFIVTDNLFLRPDLVYLWCPSIPPLAPCIQISPAMCPVSLGCCVPLPLRHLASWTFLPGQVLQLFKLLAYIPSLLLPLHPSQQISFVLSLRDLLSVEGPSGPRIWRM